MPNENAQGNQIRVPADHHTAAGLRRLALQAPVVAVEIATLKVGTVVHNVRACAIYLDAADRPMGARFVHQPIGFQIDLLLMDTVPQSCTWVKTFASSNKGEPHTQEHLLVSHGIRGRTLSAMQQMSMVRENAYTEKLRTSYLFRTEAGIDTFFALFAEQQRALLHPDYSDAAIRQETYGFKVSSDKNGPLRLHETGTIYSDVVGRSGAIDQTYQAMMHALYGENSPLSYNFGGNPDAVRTIRPEDLLSVRRAYHLGNMGAIAVLPRSAAPNLVLKRFNDILMNDAPVGQARAPAAEVDRTAS